MIDDILDFLARTAHHQRIHFLWRPVLPDPTDDHILELAVAEGCRAIVTHNRRDFVGTERFGIAVWTPAECLAQLRRTPL